MCLIFSFVDLEMAWLVRFGHTYYNLSNDDPSFLSPHFLPSMTTPSRHCILREHKASLSIDATSKISRISPSLVYTLNLPCIFDDSGVQHSLVEISIPTKDGFYLSTISFSVSYGLSSDVILGSDWLLACNPTFIDEYPFISRPSLSSIQMLPPSHNWQSVNGTPCHLCSLSLSNIM